MVKLPDKVINTYKELKKESDRYLSVKVINGHCYVYEATSRWDKENKKVRSISRYLGRITKDGIFIPGVRRDAELGGAPVDQIFDARTPTKSDEPHYKKEYISRYEKDILSALSADGRASLFELSKVIGLKHSAMEIHKRNIEGKYGIDYLAEIDARKLGYDEYLIAVKFQDEIPSLKEITNIVEKEKSIQLALLTQGDYDLVMYALIDKNKDVNAETARLRNSLFAEYIIQFYLMPFLSTYCFVPLRECFFDILKDKLKRRNEKEKGLLKREYTVLKELSRKGDMEFSEIDKNNSLSQGSSRYTYYRLIEKGIIRRTTISIQNLNVNYIVLLFVEDAEHAEFLKYKERLYENIAKATGPQVNNYLLAGELRVPDEVMMALPVLNGFDLDKALEFLKSVKGTKARRLIVTNFVVGSFDYRRLLPKESITH